MMGIPPTLRRGDHGDEVGHLQRLIGVVVDGHYGAETEMLVRARQMLYGLTIDGVCGPLTWTALLEREPFRLPSLAGLAAGEARALVAESQLGACETRQNRGPQVDQYIASMGGRPQDAPPWCAYFVSWCGQQVHDAGVPIERVISGAARSHWQRASGPHRFERDSLAATISAGTVAQWVGDGLSRALRGSVYVRARSATPEKRAAILSGARAQGHTGIVTGAHVDRLGRIVIEGIAGNSSGAGHQTLGGTGRVARERIVEGSEAWRALVGVVLP